MKHMTGKSVFTALALVMTLALATGAVALNFDDNDDPFPKERKQVSEQTTEAAVKVEEAHPVADVKPVTPPDMDMKKATYHKKMADYHHGKKGHVAGRYHGKPCAMKCPSAPDAKEMEKLNAERDKFHLATRDLRMEIKSKRLAIKSEIVKPSPNVKAALALQRELSALEAQLGEKRLLHQIEMKKISPEAPMGCMGKGCMGMNRGQMGMGYKGMDNGSQKMQGECPMMGK